MKRPNRQAQRPMAVVGLVALVALIALQGCGGGGTGGSASPTDPPISTPTLEPTAQPTLAPTAEPSAGPVSPAPDGTLVIDLVNATDHELTARIVDESSILESAVSGLPGDGMSTRWHEALVVNVDDRTLRLTWVGLPQDDVVEVSIAGTADDLEIHLVQKGPPPNSDALGFDRVIELTFSELVRSEAVTTTIEDSSTG